MPFAVRLAEVEGAFGSNDTALAETIKGKDPDWFGRTDYGEDELSPSLALDRIVAGDPLEGFGDKYGFALEKLCWHFGALLPNRYTCMIGFRGLDGLDTALRAAGVPTRRFGLLGHLVFRGPPLRMPETDGNPDIGYIRAEEMADALAAAEMADAAALGREDALAFAEIKGWMQECNRQKCDLVCFCH